MAPPAPPPRAALTLLLALSAIGPAAPAPEWPPRNGSAGRAWGGPLQNAAPINGTEPLGPQLEPPGGSPATADPTVGCMGCSGEGAASSVPPVPDAAQDPRLGITGPGDGDGGAVALGSPEEVGSGEQPTRAGVGPTEGLTPGPPSLGLSSPGPNLGLPDPNLSLDLPDPNLGLPDPNLGLPNPSLGLPSPGPTLDRPIPNPNPNRDLPNPNPSLGIPTSNLGLSNPNVALTSPSPNPGTEPNLLPVAEDSELSMELPQPSSSPAPAQRARGRTDRTWLGAPEPISAAPGTAEPPEIIDVDYYDVFDGGEGPGGGRGAGGAAQREPGGAATPWGLHELYDDFTPFDEADFYPTTSFYAEGDEEEEEELEEDEEEEEEEDGGLEDENGYRPPASAAPRVPPPPSPTEGSPMARPRPGERAVPENSSECRNGYVRHNSSCRSVCDLVPSYCHNGGQCYLVESHGAFCRCNTQDYTWHKGTRCEAIVTDFQVLCVAVGSAALVLLLLFMLTVFFAKKLYLLKTENSKLRKTKYRTPSELHNDNFSLSTIAEGSHPNDDPGAPHKLQDPLKPGLKDEEPLSILSAAPEEGSKGEPGGCGVPCLHNNLG
ncbi:chondroitin sulfate proteoglycan 5 isoform X1 [Lagopus muta]|uniref:chondroitin sulfate proteoglycan 5 isoform X1 n=1 Tax=Lagopus muta TaxID=64668 RepID=UPI0020A19130|nr:chondroitin sulfate proteoglycan 5 isoform X1 [Lagopus muta]